MTKELIIKYFRCKSTPAEEKAVLDWASHSSENMEEFKRMDLMFSASTLHGDQKPKAVKINLFRSIIRYASVAAAALVFALGGGYFYGEHRSDLMAAQMVKLTVPTGQRISLTLQDGTNVSLRSGSTIEYPAAFRKGERKVRLDGEAIFDVTKDEKHPFVVGTYACDVKVLGTNFDVTAMAEKDRFSTSLMRGKVEVTNNLNSERVILLPGQTVSLENGLLVKRNLPDRDDFLWNEGIISLRCGSFQELMDRFESAFDVTINVEEGFDPAITTRGKVRVSDGIVHSLDVLKTYMDFSYEYIRTDNVINITRD